METENIEINTLKPIFACISFSKPFPERMYAKSVKNVNRAKHERKSKIKQQEITKQQSIEGEITVKR